MGTYSTPGMTTYASKRASAIAERKHGNATGNTFKMPSPEDHISAERDHIAEQDHIYAAKTIEPHDHESAADHLHKASIHSEAAAGHFEKHSKKWIQGAIKHPGAFTAKAKAAGKSVKQEAASVLKKGSHASSKTKKQAVLAKTLGSFHKK
jgi:hypothetical protein